MNINVFNLIQLSPLFYFCAVNRSEVLIQDALRAQAEGFNKTLQSELKKQEEQLATKFKDDLNLEVTFVTSLPRR